MKKILFGFFLTLFLISNLFSNVINFSKSEDRVLISLSKIPKSYKIVYYDYGFNIFAYGISIENMEISKFQNDVVVRVIPLKKNSALIKIQYPIKVLKNHVKVSIDNSFNIQIFKKPIIIKEEKSIVDIATKDLAIVPKSEGIGLKIKPTVVNKANKNTQRINKRVEKTNITTKKKNNENFQLPSDKKYSFSSNVIKTYSVLFILCLLIIGGGIFFKKFYNKISTPIGSDVVKILYKKDILPKKTIAIAKIFNDYYILGITQNSINAIDKISSDALKEELKFIEGEKEKSKFIKYLKEQEDKENSNIDKEKMIKLIQLKLREYRKNLSNAS